MKVILVLLALLVVIEAKSSVFEHCKLSLDKIPKEIKINDLMGHWYLIRKGPYPKEVKKKFKIDCSEIFMYREVGKPQNIADMVHHYRLNGKTHITNTQSFNLTAGDDDGMFANCLKFNKNIHLPHIESAEFDTEEKIVETDHGKTWSLWAICVKHDAGSSLLWAIKSRCPAMDAKLEDTIMEKIEKYNRGPIKLCGVAHNQCH